MIFEANQLLAVALHALADCLRLCNALAPKSHKSSTQDLHKAAGAEALVEERKIQAEAALERAIEVNEETLSPTDDRVAKNCIGVRVPSPKVNV